MVGSGSGAVVDWGRIEDGAVAVKDGRITWVGSREDLVDAPESLARVVNSGDGGWITPALIDCHTHIVHGGQRAVEFEQRLTGVSYADIAAAGGGIRSTVAATRMASEQELFDSAARRLAPLLAEGVTVVEIKSGYGLDLDTELKMLRVARALGERLSVTIVTTFLGAHAIPPEFAGESDRYIDLSLIHI